MNADLDDFERLAAALEPWLPDLVIVGGWAHRLHHEHPRALAPSYMPVRTRDVDMAFGARSRLAGTIDRALAEAGFREELSSDETPPVARYHLGADDQGFYAEFLTPLVGDGIKRDGSVDATASRAGITAQKLRHLEVLLVAPWRMSVGGGESRRLPVPLEVRVANPVSFVVQKLLIHGDRVPAKRAQDLLYIHDTIQLFGDSLGELNEVWRETVRGELTSNQRNRVHEMRSRLFLSVTDSIREAALIPMDRNLRAEDVRSVCEHGLTAILVDQ